MHPKIIPHIETRLPRICYLLGTEDNPLEEDEEFKLSGDTWLFRIHKGIVEHNHPDFGWEGANAESIGKMINHPENIIRRPQFSDDQKSMMREYLKFGISVIRKPAGYGTRIERPDGTWYPLPDGMFPQITPENSPFDFAAYLKSST
jgi:hypothetical protein